MHVQTVQHNRDTVCKLCCVRYRPCGVHPRVHWESNQPHNKWNGTWMCHCMAFHLCVDLSRKSTLDFYTLHLMPAVTIVPLVILGQIRNTNVHFCGSTSLSTFLSTFFLMNAFGNPIHRRRYRFWHPTLALDVVVSTARDNLGFLDLAVQGSRARNVT